jgi:hypothetical protein
MTYEQVSSITQVARSCSSSCCSQACDLRLLSGNKKRFEEDAKIPLQKDPDQETED